MTPVQPRQLGGRDKGGQNTTNLGANTDAKHTCTKVLDFYQANINFFDVNEKMYF